MMSELLAAEIDGERLSMEDTVSFCILLLLAGHVTTTNLLGQAGIGFTALVPETASLEELFLGMTDGESSDHDRVAAVAV